MCVLVINDGPALIDDDASGPWGAAAPLPEEDGMDGGNATDAGIVFGIFKVNTLHVVDEFCN